MDDHSSGSVAEPLVTVALSCYNHEQYITDAVLSILRQTYPAIELLVYDDGSTDGSVPILQALADTHGFFFQAQANIGLSATLNQALERARGKYFFQMGSDDIAFLDKVEKQVTFLEANPEYAVCGGNAIYIDGKGQLLNKRQVFHPARELVFEDFFEGRKPGFAASTALVRTEAMRAVGGYRPDIALEDIYMWMKLSSEGYRFYALNDIMLYYRKHGSNTYKNTAFMRDCIRKTLLEYRDHPSFERVYAKEMNSLLLTAAKQKQKALARDILKDISLRHYSKKTIRALARMIF
ncbi:glycosyltransferase family 2 protein [Litorivivens sp.]|uniref:glycosyltransferase family 2 protein n=1 Tax=Litorivivens sp. TaxID=2020868 RepID=UPI0035628944